jgi:hypothetical protein
MPITPSRRVIPVPLILFVLLALIVPLTARAWCIPGTAFGWNCNIDRGACQNYAVQFGSSRTTAFTNAYDACIKGEVAVPSPTQPTPVPAPATAQSAVMGRDSVRSRPGSYGTSPVPTSPEPDSSAWGKKETPAPGGGTSGTASIPGGSESECSARYPDGYGSYLLCIENGKSQSGPAPVSPASTGASGFRADQLVEALRQCENHGNPSSCKAEAMANFNTSSGSPEAGGANTATESQSNDTNAITQAFRDRAWGITPPRPCDNGFDECPPEAVVRQQVVDECQGEYSFFRSIFGFTQTSFNNCVQNGLGRSGIGGAYVEDRIVPQANSNSGFIDSSTGLPIPQPRVYNPTFPSSAEDWSRGPQVVDPLPQFTGFFDWISKCFGFCGGGGIQTNRTNERPVQTGGWTGFTNAQNYAPVEERSINAQPPLYNPYLENRDGTAYGIPLDHGYDSGENSIIDFVVDPLTGYYSVAPLAPLETLPAIPEQSSYDDWLWAVDDSTTNVYNDYGHSFDWTGYFE